MQFSNTTSKNGLVEACEFRLGFADAAISGTAATLDHFTRLINNRYFEIITMVLVAQDEWDWDDPVNNVGAHAEATRLLVANQRDYLFQTASWGLIGEEGASAQSNAAIAPLRINRVDICYSGTGNTCYRAEPLDKSELIIGLGNDTEVDGRFARERPFYDVTNAGIFIYPRASVAEVAAGAVIRVHFTRMPDIFLDTDTTQEPALDEPFHEMIAIGASMDYAAMKGLKVLPSLQQQWRDYERRIKQYYGSKQKDRNITLTSIYDGDSGNEYGR